VLTRPPELSAEGCGPQAEASGGRERSGAQAWRVARWPSPSVGRIL